MEMTIKIRAYIILILQSDVVLKVGSKNPVLETVKGLLDRAAPLLVDEQCIKELFKLVKDAVEGLSDEEDDEYEWHESVGASLVGKKGLALLLVSQLLLKRLIIIIMFVCSLK